MGLYIQYQCIYITECIFLKDKRQNPTDIHISPNCWQCVPNTITYIQLTSIPPLFAVYIQYQYIRISHDICH